MKSHTLLALKFILYSVLLGCIFSAKVLALELTVHEARTLFNESESSRPYGGAPRFVGDMNGFFYVVKAPANLDKYSKYEISYQDALWESGRSSGYVRDYIKDEYVYLPIRSGNYLATSIVVGSRGYSKNEIKILGTIKGETMTLEYSTLFNDESAFNAMIPLDKANTSIVSFRGIGGFSINEWTSSVEQWLPGGIYCYDCKSYLRYYVTLALYSPDRGTFTSSTRSSLLKDIEVENVTSYKKIDSFSQRCVGSLTHNSNARIRVQFKGSPYINISTKEATLGDNTDLTVDIDGFWEDGQTVRFYKEGSNQTLKTITAEVATTSIPLLEGSYIIRSEILADNGKIVNTSNPIQVSKKDILANCYSLMSSSVHSGQVVILKDVHRYYDSNADNLKLVDDLLDFKLKKHVGIFIISDEIPTIFLPLLESP